VLLRKRAGKEGLRFSIKWELVDNDLCNPLSPDCVIYDFRL